MVNFKQNTNYSYYYIIALSIIAMLALGSFMVVNIIIGEQEKNASIINISGSQRALSQRIAFCATYLYYTDNVIEKANIRKEIEVLVDKMEKQHKALLNGDDNFDIGKISSAKLKKVYLEPPVDLNKKITAYFKQIRAFNQAVAKGLPLEEPFSVIVDDNLSSNILTALDIATQTHTEVSQAESYFLRGFELAILVSMLIALLLEVPLLFLPMIREIKENQNLYEQNEQYLKKIEELDYFAYLASHDLKQPIRNIMSFSQLLQLRAGSKLNENEQEFLIYIMQNAKNMNNLLEELRAYSYLKQDFKIKSIRLSTVLDIAKDNLSMLISENNTRIILNNDCLLKGNKVQLSQLFQNLIANSIHYNEKQPEIVIDSTEDKSSVVICFSDNGIGISKEYQEKIFAPFQRINLDKNPDGSGFGLFICKIINNHNGTLRIESAEGKGSVFFIKLPQ